MASRLQKGMGTRRCDALRLFESVTSHGISRLMYPKNGIFSRRSDDSRRDAQRRIARIVSCGVPRLLLAQFGMLSSRRDGRRRFASVVYCGFPGLMYAIMES